jgi:C4-dicarboxylate transporter DctM subunit
MEPWILMLILMALFLLMRVPIAVALAFSATCVLFITEGTTAIEIIAQRMYGVTRSWVLLAIPFFMLAGAIMESGGLTRRIVAFASALVGFLPGGLAAVNVLASMLFGGITGSASADTSALGSILIPAMRRQNYSGPFAAAVTASSSCIGMIIPPSIPMVLWSFVSGISLGNLFLGGMIPGILVGLIQIILCTIISSRKGYGERQPFSLREIIVQSKDGILTLIAPFLIIGGIVSGLFTPTEAAIIAVLYCLVLSMFIYKELRLKDLPKVFLKAGTLSAMVLFIVAGSSLFSYVLTIMDVPIIITEKLLTIGGSPGRFIIITVALFMLLGMIMDISVIILLVGPIIAPLMLKSGVDPIQGAMIYMVILAAGLVTPPVGLCIFVASGVSGLSVEAIAKDSIPFVFGILAVALIIWFVPATALWFPSLFGM